LTIIFFIFPQNQNDRVVRIANRAYAAKDVTLHPDFLRTIRDTLHADAFNIDFNTPSTAANIINSWIEEVTENKIKNMVTSGQKNNVFPSMHST
jgi:serine protease inhibitor